MYIVRDKHKFHEAVLSWDAGFQAQKRQAMLSESLETDVMLG